MVYIVEITRISAFRGYMTWSTFSFLSFCVCWLYPVTTRCPAGGTLDFFNRCWETELVLMWFVWRSGRRWSRALPSGLCVLRASGSRGLRWPSRRFTSLESLPWTSLWESRESKRSSMHPKTSGDFINAVIPRKPGHIRECFPALENIYAFSRRFYPKHYVYSGYT